MAVNGFQCSVGVYRETVGSITENRAWDLLELASEMRLRERTIFLMTSPELEMSVAFPGMIDGVPICDLGQEGPWVLGKRMKGETVHCQNE